MIQEGQIVLFRFPQTDFSAGKLRPALTIRKLPGPFDDWLICMISSQVGQAISGFDETLRKSDPDFRSSGLKLDSVIRISRLAVVERRILVGVIGRIDTEHLLRI